MMVIPGDLAKFLLKFNFFLSLLLAKDMVCLTCRRILFSFKSL